MSLQCGSLRSFWVITAAKEEYQYGPRAGKEKRLGQGCAERNQCGRKHPFAISSDICASRHFALEIAAFRADDVIQTTK
jgi:hypothetical protein